MTKKMDIAATASNLLTDLYYTDLRFELTRRDYYAVWGLLNSALHDRSRNEETRERWVNMAHEMLAEIKGEQQALWDAQAEAHAIKILHSIH